MSTPAFYYDISSPYAYLAAERMSTVLPDADWQPILIGGLFKLNGRTSWVFSDERESRMAEIEERAKRYGLPPITWPMGLPDNQLGLQRAATVAKRHERAAGFALEAFRATYVRGIDPSSDEGLREVAAAVDLDGDALIAGIAEQDVKDELRRTTERAHEQGVPGVPTVVVDGEVFWGDDRLEEAAAAAGPA
jgi:2-hydroxychromene-2-carboxylate isomerase